MQTAEIETEIEKLSKAIPEVEAALHACEEKCDVSAAGVKEHSLLSSKLAMLRTRLTTLQNAKPLAQLAALKEVVAKWAIALKESGEALKNAEKRTREQLIPIMGENWRMEDALQQSLAVMAANGDTFWKFTRLDHGEVHVTQIRLSPEALLAVIAIARSMGVFDKAEGDK